jgi:N-acetyl-D-muramate 6-phosphate phosphatase
MGRPAALLFDLDGTLLDSAPDLAGTANDMLASRGRPPLPYGDLRLHAGSGARGMLGAAFDIHPQQPGYESLRDEFHDRYEQRMTRESVLFAAVETLLDALDRHALPWGIVTNKALRFAAPLVSDLAPLARGAVLVGGDSTPHTKPHPAPLLEAVRRLGCAPQACIYVGDDLRDMHAARAAGMGAWAAAWGYLGPGLPPTQWGADAVLAHPIELLTLLDLP